jgi:hypothetical protein
MPPPNAHPIAPGTNWIFPIVDCQLDAGWALVHRAEADANLKDRFAGQTCVRDDGEISLFLPSTLDEVNRVHLFFSAGGIAGDVLNSVVAHALRHAAEQAGWILIAVNGHATGALTTISAWDIMNLLYWHGRAPRIDHFRISAHSRGVETLNACLNTGTLIAHNAAPPVLAPSSVERAVCFDAEYGMFWDQITKQAGVAPDVVYGFKAISSPWNMPLNRTIALGNFTGTPPVGDLFARGLRAIEYMRLVDDAKTLRPGLAIPTDVDAALTDLGPVPALGTFTSRGAAAAPLSGVTGLLRSFGGPWNFFDWCRTNEAAIQRHLGDELDLKRNSPLFDFIASNDLVRIVDTSLYTPPILHHHLLVAEFAHEVTDDAAPVAGP